MKEQRQIVERWKEGSGSILITLVRVQGSSYRQPGARLMICKDGTYEGGVSGGCLEADLLRKAAWLIRDGSIVERYSTLFDETSEIPFGLGCGGVLDVLLESAATAECHALLKAIEETLSGQEHVVATWLPQDGDSMLRAVFRPDGEVVFASQGLSNERLSSARLKHIEGGDIGSDEMFMERLVPPQRLFVFGAGDDAKPLLTMACMLGWTVTVVDGQAHLARKNRFSGIKVNVVSNPDLILSQMSPRDAAVIMTHSYEQDREYLTSLLPLRPRYLGLLGSRQRSSLLIAEAAAKLEWSLSECCEHIRAPIGLDIGGEGPAAIALAIISEAQACCSERRGESRKLSAEKVERYLASSEPRLYLQTQCSLDII